MKCNFYDKETDECILKMQTLSNKSKCDGTKCIFQLLGALK